ncbi:MAG: flagellar basal body L-ring protein FlgH [Rhodospirillaceae bacterium]
MIVRKDVSRKLPFRALITLILSATALSGCSNLERLTRVGQAPSMSPVANPTEKKDYRPVSMPMPTPVALNPNANSLWRPGARAFFKDQRAGMVGDVLTVVVAIQNESATLNAETRRTRDNVTETLNVNNLFNAQNRILPGKNQAPALDIESGSDYRGSGNVTRDETVNIRLAAVVLQILPNGNLAIAGRQEVRVNNELRELTVAGVIRPEDIGSDNTISWDKIAEARISYGGRGSLSDVQQPRYGQQIFDIVFPF